MRTSGSHLAHSILDATMRQAFAGCTESLMLDEIRRWIQRNKERGTPSDFQYNTDD
ncbi:unnamed protein product, partial [Dicrocoelium dendriticum]